MVKKIIKVSIRLLIGIVILFFLSNSFNLSEAINAILDASLYWIVFSLCIILALRVIVVFRWKIILDYQKLFVPLIELVKINYVSSAVGQVLPGGIGGDLLRGYKLNQKYNQLSNTTSSIILDRILGIVSMIIVALIGSIISDLIGLEYNLSIYLLSLLVIIVLFFVAGDKLNIAQQYFQKIKNKRILNVLKKIEDLYHSVTDLKKVKSIFVSVFSISIIVQLLRCLIFYLLFLAFGYSINFIYFIIAIPITLVLSIIPISIAGLGVREGSLVYFFTSIGISAEVCIGVGLLFHVLQIVASLPGIGIWIFEKK